VHCITASHPGPPVSLSAPMCRRAAVCFPLEITVSLIHLFPLLPRQERSSSLNHSRRSTTHGSRSWHCRPTLASGDDGGESPRAASSTACPQLALSYPLTSAFGRASWAPAWCLKLGPRGQSAHADPLGVLKSGRESDAFIRVCHDWVHS
jgi:hypothetical protein